MWWSANGCGFGTGGEVDVMVPTDTMPCLGAITGGTFDRTEASLPSKEFLCCNADCVLRPDSGTSVAGFGLTGLGALAKA